MESKYKERAEEIIEVNNLTTCRECICSNDDWIKVMCQLAEEVENNWMNFFLRTPLLEYTKEQVEELLREQRELCAKEAVSNHIEHYNYEQGFRASVNENSILNAKLIIK